MLLEENFGSLIAKIRDEPWVMGLKNLPIPSHLEGERVENLIVSLLLDAETNSLNEQLVRCTFNPQIATEILTIRLNSTPRPNQWIWVADKQEKFSIKSAYKTTQSIKKMDQAECSNPSPLKQVWKQFWQMKAPHTVKIFAWHAYRDAFPTLTNL